MSPPHDDFQSHDDFQYTVRQAAEWLGVVEKTIRRYLRRGLLEAVQVPGPHGLEYRISEASLHHLAAALQRPPPPSETQSTLSPDQVEQGLNRLLFEVETLQSTQRLILGYLREREGEGKSPRGEDLRALISQIRQEQNQLREILNPDSGPSSFCGELLQSLAQLHQEVRDLRDLLQALEEKVALCSSKLLPRRPWWRLWGRKEES